MILSLIAAIGKNGELGKDNKLVWDMPADMKYFRDTTRGKPVIMGRKTFESIGHPLPKRRNIVITRDPSYTHGGVEVANSMEDALALFEDTDEEIFCIGGAEIYNLAFNQADRLYVTEIDRSFTADTFFPRIDHSRWEKTKEEPHPADDENPYPYTFIVYKKKAA